MSQTGRTISLDFDIGNKKYLGCGLGAPTLSAFVTFYKNEVDNRADTFFIDPDKITLELSVYIIKPVLIKRGSMKLQKDALLVIKAI